MAVLILICLSHHLAAVLTLLSQFLSHSQQVAFANRPSSQLVKVLKSSPQILLLISIVLHRVRNTILAVMNLRKASLVMIPLFP